MQDENRKIDDKTEVKVTELASILGLTARRVQQLGQDGIFSTIRRGRYLLGDSVQKYISFITKRASTEDELQAERNKRDAEVRIKQAKATVAELEAKELEGNMHRSEDVAAMTEDLIYNIRGALNALPGRLAVDCAASKTAAETADIIRKEVFKLMRGLSDYNYDPKKYEERVRERRSWSPSESDDDDD